MHNTVWVNHKFLTHHYQATSSQKTTPVWHRCPISNTPTFLNVSFFYWKSSIIVFAIAGLRWTVRKTKKKKAVAVVQQSFGNKQFENKKGKSETKERRRNTLEYKQLLLVVAFVFLICWNTGWAHYFLVPGLECTALHVWMFHLILLKSLLWWRRNLVKGDLT